MRKNRNLFCIDKGKARRNYLKLLANEQNQLSYYKIRLTIGISLVEEEAEVNVRC